MDTGFVLIITLPTCEKHVHKKLKKIKEILNVSPIFGDYDFIVKIKINSLENLGKFIIENIRTINGIKKTETLSGTNL
jgi:DNA-binding Lrp family transcriptional regulator